MSSYEDEDFLSHFRGDTPLHLAIKNKRKTQAEIIEALKILLEQNVDVNVENRCEQTALHLAVLNRMKDVIDFLIERKANRGRIAYFFIGDEYEKFCILLDKFTLTEDKVKIERLQRQEIESVNFVEWLISRGFDFDFASEFLPNAVYKTIECNLQHVLLVLLKNTENISFVDKQNKTLLHLFLEISAEFRDESFQNPDALRKWYSNRYILDIIKILLDRGVPVDAEDAYNRTPIEVALLAHQNCSVIEKLIERCPKMYNKRHGETTLLHLMTEEFFNSEWKTENFLKLLKTMIAKGISMNDLKDPDEKGWTLLSYAVYQQDVQIIDFLYDIGVTDFSVLMKNNGSLLHLLAMSCCRTNDGANIELFNLLVSNGCKVNANDAHGRTPLHEAVNYNRTVIVQKLIEQGAEVNCTTNDGWTPLHVAINKKSDVCIVQLLEKSGADFTATTHDGENLLHLLVSKSSEQDGYAKKLFDLLLRNGCSVNARDVKGQTPLLQAIKCYDYDIVRKLIEHGAEVNYVTEEGMTPLLIAAGGDPFFRQYNVHLVKLLLAAGADPTVTTNNNENMLHLLAKIYEKKVAEDVITEQLNLFIRIGCQVNAKDAKGITALHNAVMTFSNEIVVKKLIEHGADVNCRISNRGTPLHIAGYETRNLKVAELLLKHGINVNAKDREGKTILHLIARRSLSYWLEFDNKLIDILLAFGADVTMQDSKERSALYYAVTQYTEDSAKDDIFESLDGEFDEEEYDSEVTVTLIGHSIKLKAADLPWDKEISYFIGSTRIRGNDYNRENFYTECLKEMETLKSTFLDSRTSLYTMLHMNLNRRCAYLHNEKWQKLVHSAKLQEQFPKYSVLILANYRETVIRKSLLIPAKMAWIELTQIRLPEICIELILSFLSNSNLYDMLEKDA